MAKMKKGDLCMMVKDRFFRTPLSFTLGKTNIWTTNHEVGTMCIYIDREPFFEAELAIVLINGALRSIHAEHLSMWEPK